MENKLPERKPTRLKNFDYSSRGAYFFTICAKDRARIFSDVVKTNVMATDKSLSFSVGDGANAMLPHVVSTFKRLCNKELGANVFQRSYAEHIIRDKEDYETRKKYLLDNPARWYYNELSQRNRVNNHTSK